MTVRAIAYASQAAGALSAEKVEQIAENARVFNLVAGVTGVLLFDGTRFLQYIEGPGDALEAAYSRILYARSHCEIMELMRGTLRGRLFPYWSMRCLPTPEPMLSRVANSDWRSFMRRGPGNLSNGTAVDQLSGIVEQHLRAA